ncbi:MAG TPA: hypothetical protein VFE62_20235 [Gemmataceae bacterium]|nr:hypothetical protein [Gemmataceae bacterium]
MNATAENSLKQAPQMQAPKKGEHYRCEKCGMEMEVTADCKEQGHHARLECCGQPLTRS